jgi:hypothetical protein
MLYNMSYKKNLLKDIFSQNTVPLAVRCFNVACSSVSAVFLLSIDFLVAYVVEHHLHILEWYHTPTSDF